MSANKDVEDAMERVLTACSAFVSIMNAVTILCAPALIVGLYRWLVF